MLSELSPEVLRLIFAFACTDGGSTAASLLECSCYISTVARPFRFQTVSLVGHERISRFLYAFRGAVGAGGDSLVHVHRLFVSNRAPVEQYQNLRPLLCMIEDVMTNWVKFLRDLFAIVGGRLLELALVMDRPDLPATNSESTSALGLFGAAAFPALEVLTIVCNHLSSVSDVTIWQPLPRLRRLQLDAQVYLNLCLPLLRTVANSCSPGLRLVLHNVAVQQSDVSIVRALLGAPGQPGIPTTKIPFDHVEIRPMWERTGARALQGAHGGRVTVLPVNPQERTYAEWKRDCLS
jgi:hypothetical protein